MDPASESPTLTDLRYAFVVAMAAGDKAEAQKLFDLVLNRCGLAERKRNEAVLAAGHLLAALKI